MTSFAGRARELSLATGALEGHGGVLLIHGPGGIGKTRLLREALDQIVEGAPRRPVLYGRANQQDADLAFAPLLDALTGYLDQQTPAAQHELLADLDELGDLLVGYGLSAGPATDRDALRRTRRLDAIRRLIGRIEDDPLLALDDAHWADDATLAALAHLSRSMDGGSLTVALTFRDAEANPDLRATLATLRRAGAVTDLALGPVDDQVIERILREELSAEPTAELIALICSRSAGNILHVTSLARHLRDSGLVRRRFDGLLQLVPGAEPGVPAEVGDMMAARRDRLSPSAVVVLRSLGVADAPTAIDILLAVTGLPLQEVEGAVDELVDGGLAVEHPQTGAISAAHPLVGEAAYLDMGERARRRMHAAFVEAIEQRRDEHPLGRLARHYRLAGGDVDPGRAIDTLVEAVALALRRWAPREALLHAQAAVDLARRSGARPLPPLLAWLASSWSMSDEDETAEEILRAALDMVDPDTSPALTVELLAELATVLYYRTRPAEALACLERAATLDPAAAAAHLVPWRQAHLAFTYGPPGVLQTVAAAQPQPGLPDGCAELICAMAAQDRGDLPAAIDLATPLVSRPGRSTAQSSTYSLEIRSLGVLAMCGAFLGDQSLVDEHAQRILGHAQALRSPPVRWRATTSHYLLGHVVGRDVGSEQEFLEQLRSADSVVHFAHSLAVPAAWSGDPGQLRDRLVQLAAPASPDQQARRSLNDLWAICAARAGLPADAVDVDLALPPQTHSTMPPVNLLAHALLRAGDDHPDVVAVDELGRRLRAMGGARSIPGVYADWVALHLAAPTMDSDEVVALATGLAQRCAEGGWRRVEAWVARAGAQLLVERDPGAAADLAGRALDLAEQLGERVDVDAAHAVLRAVGVRRRASRPSTDGVLTTRQSEIAALVGEGLSNAEIADRLFISVRTVTTHLDHIYQRLGISSRHALASRVRDGEVT